MSPCSSRATRDKGQPVASRRALQCPAVPRGCDRRHLSAMALLPILEYPHPRLRTVARPVDAGHLEDHVFQRLLDDMFQTMYEAPGIGLAATQVDTHQRFMVIDIT